MSVTLKKSAAGAGKVSVRLLKIFFGAAFVSLVFILAGRTLRHIAINQLAELTGAKVRAKSVDFSFDGSVLIEKLVIRPYRKQSYDNAILKAEKVYVRFGIGSLLLLHPRLKKVAVSDFLFDAQYDLDESRWNVSALKIKGRKGGSGKLPVISLEKGMLQYSKISGAWAKIIAQMPVNAEFGLADDEKPGAAEKAKTLYGFKITTAPMAGGSGEGILTGFWKPGRVTFTGQISSTNIPDFEKALAVDELAAELNYEPDGSYSLKLKAENLKCRPAPPLYAGASDEPLFSQDPGLFAVARKFFSRYQPLGQADLDIEASGSLQQPAKSKLLGRLYCKNVSIFHRNFPYLIENLTGRIDFTERSVFLDNLYGRHNDVGLHLNGWSRDYSVNRQYQFRITSDNMFLDDDLYRALPPRLKKVWTGFSPAGVAAVDYRISRHSQADKKITLSIRPLGADAEYKCFPYPMKNLTGEAFFDGDSVTISNLTSQAGDCRITLNGKVTHLGAGRPIYDIAIEANNVPLDSTLLSAMPPEQTRLYSRFNTSGLLHIKNLSGRIRSTAESSEPSFRLKMRSGQTELSSCLLDMLPPSLGKFISQSQPGGKVNINVDLDKAAAAELPDYKIIVDCLGNSIRLERFPYPLKDITGSIAATKNLIEFQNITASVSHNIQITPEPSSIKLTGRIALSDNIFDNAAFRLSANDIFLDEAFGIALPEYARSFYDGLAPTGRFDLDLENIEIFNGPTNEKQIVLAGDIRFKNCNFNTFAAPLELNAILKIKGSYKTDSGFCNGRAALVADTLRIRDKALTALKADIDYNPSTQSWSTKNLTADCYDGILTAKLELKQPLHAAAAYTLQTGFENIDLKQFLADTEPLQARRNGHTSGRLNGSLSVSAELGNASSRIGRCRLAITDMQVGRLSPLAKLLSVLKLTEPTDFAFERMFIDSYIKHNRLLFERFDLSGASVAFNGSGSMDLQTNNVDLTLTARGRRLATAEPSLFQSLTEGLGYAVVRMDVTGNVYDPQVTTRTLPVIKDSLQILGTKNQAQKQ